MYRVARQYFRGEEVPRMALQVQRPTSPHLEDKRKHRTKGGALDDTPINAYGCVRTIFRKHVNQSRKV